MKKWFSHFRDKTVWILAAAGAAVGVIYGILNPPVFLHITDGITYAAVILLAVGFIVIFYKEGDIVKGKNEDGKKLGEIRQTRQKERSGTRNPALYSGIILFVIALILTFLYSA